MLITLIYQNVYFKYKELRCLLHLCCYVFAGGRHVFWTWLDVPWTDELKWIFLITCYIFLTQIPTGFENSEKTQLAQRTEIYCYFLDWCRLPYWITLETCSQGQNESYQLVHLQMVRLLTFEIYFLKPKLNIPIDKNNATQGPVLLDETKDGQL